MKEKFVYPVSECDAWHTWSSMEMKGIYSSREEAVEAILENNCYEYSDFFDEDDDCELTDEEKDQEVKDALMNELRNAWQTQGHSTNYIIEKWQMNDWA